MLFSWLRASALSLGVVAFLTAGCGNSDAPADGALDASRFDAAADAAHVDAPAFRDGGTCSLSCGANERCCSDDEDVEMCVDIVNDVAHCGGCAGDCVGFQRGDRCTGGRCACGNLGPTCTGGVESVCCVNPDTGLAGCANTVRDPAHCGGCFQQCEVARASTCQNGGCSCGSTGTECDGTPTSMCCDFFVDGFQCTDTTSDRMNCGACGRRCVNGLCVAGECVYRDAGPRDAATVDAPSDARVDATVDDGGSTDAGSTDGDGSSASPADAGA